MVRIEDLQKTKIKRLRLINALGWQLTIERHEYNSAKDIKPFIPKILLKIEESKSEVTDEWDFYQVNSFSSQSSFSQKIR